MTKLCYRMAVLTERRNAIEEKIVKIKSFLFEKYVNWLHLLMPTCYLTLTD